VIENVFDAFFRLLITSGAQLVKKDLWSDLIKSVKGGKRSAKDLDQELFQVMIFLAP
jgi:hypothetical protein